MKTTYRIREPYCSTFMDCADRFVNVSPAKPVRFIEKMKNNTGMAGRAFGLTDENGLERRNPVIVALGDSVTAGHFESLMTPDLTMKMMTIFADLQKGVPLAEIAVKVEEMGGMPVVEITDARESYIEKFRGMLIDKYELTSVSIINSGIAGDMLPSMIERADRDVIVHHPDLVLINGSLNWNDDILGDASAYKQMLKGLVQKLKAETEADIILLTPNGDLPNTMFAVPGMDIPEPTTEGRVRAIREVAEEEKVCLADVRAVWDSAKEAGCPWEELLANRINHPSVEGHEVYAKVLMKLFED